MQVLIVMKSCVFEGSLAAAMHKFNKCAPFGSWPSAPRPPLGDMESPDGGERIWSCRALVKTPWYSYFALSLGVKVPEVLAFKFKSAVAFPFLPVNEKTRVEFRRTEVSIRLYGWKCCAR